MTWEQLISAALAGAGDQGEDPGALLDQAALLTVQRRAGYTARLAENAAQPPAERPGAAPAETLARVPERAGQRLARLLGGEHQRFLPEWLEAAAAHGLRAPEELLPALLDRGSGDRSLRAALGVIAGQRGRWLAGLNPRWTYLLAERAAEPAQEETWELGTAGDRRQYLLELRKSDPAAAREALAATWRQETPEDRGEFLASFWTGLSAGDEDFLEQALDDRRREVRQVAADLLTRLPGSALGNRMAARATACLRMERGRVVAEPPTECDAGMERDGIRPRPPRGTGNRRWWLQQLLARTPLRTWPGYFGEAPQSIVRRVSGEWATEIRTGFLRAAVLQRDKEWARALFAHEPSGDLLSVLPDDERSRAAAKVVAEVPLDGALITLLGAVPAPWAGPLAQSVVVKIARASQPWQSLELARLAAIRLDPSLYARLEIGIVPAIDDLAETLRFRHDMLREFE